MYVCIVICDVGIVYINRYTLINILYNIHIPKQIKTQFNVIKNQVASIFLILSSIDGGAKDQKEKNELEFTLCLMIIICQYR